MATIRAGRLTSGEAHPRLRPGLIVACVMLLFAALNVYLWRGVRGDDWSSIFVAARLIARGQIYAIYDHDPNVFSLVSSPRFEAAAADINFNGPGHPYVHLPLLAYMLSPLARIGSFPIASQVLTVANVLATLGIVWFAAKIFDNRLLRPAPLAAILLVVTVSEPLRYSLFLGQTTPLVLFAMVYAIHLSRQGHPVPAGILLALATAIKITPVIVALYWLWNRRQRRSAMTFAVSMALIIAASVLLVGWQANVDYAHTLRRVSDSGLPSFNNHSLVGWALTRSVSEERLRDFTIVPISTAVRLFNLTLLAATVAAVGFLGRFLARRGDAGRASDDRTCDDLDRLLISALFLLPLVFTPISWTHYYLAMVVPILALSGAYLDRRAQWGGVLVVLLVLLNTQPVATDSMLGRIGILVHAHLWSAVLAVMALLGLPLAAWRRDRSSTPERRGFRRGRQTVELGLKATPGLTIPHRLATLLTGRRIHPAPVDVFRVTTAPPWCERQGEPEGICP